MDWDSMLYLAILGVLLSTGLVVYVSFLGIRYRRELPKVAIKESLEALLIAQEKEEAKLADLQNELSDAQSDIREGQRAQEFLDRVRPEMQRLQAESETLVLAKEKAERETTSALDELGRARADVETASSQKTELEAELSTLRVTLAEARAHLESAHSELQGFEAKREELRDIESRLPSLRAELEELSQKVSDSRGDVNELQERSYALKAEFSELSGTVASLREDQVRLDKERERLLQAIEELKRAHSSAGGVEEGHDPCDDLWVPYFSERIESAGLEEEGARLAEMEQQLRRVDVRIPQRTLRAFHTALKIQDMSPLTVLAGISGTGKSLLPRLYSKCMGLHFLNLPVQPGWNSPQDLFGFYNYIEHRFKATPLAQALVQFDQFNREKWRLPPENVSLEDQVLLVLLDEMNLARVEYYFSELLSRLEVRRSINPLDAVERQKVEIPLEIGHLIRNVGEAGQAHGVSIYPGENVLFAGTMNEDESTMSLSDKVLDRATVLRFGRPSKMIHRAPDMSSMESAAPLSLSMWKRWMEPQRVAQEISDSVGRLSEIMAKAGSPFGHRVAQGIMQYVSLYPDSSDAGQRQALIDQVEQKILPKLRGRDLNSIGDSLSMLSTLIRELEDGPLDRAIGQARNDQEGTFMWIGLDRGES